MAGPCTKCSTYFVVGIAGLVLLVYFAPADNNSREGTGFTNFTKSITLMWRGSLQRRVEWVSFDMIQLGTINMQCTSTQSFVIPSSVPSTAGEVLVYVYAYMGHSQDLLAQMKIYTESIPTRRFEKYITIKTYSQEAYTVASDNMFFPMPSNRRVYVMLSQTLPGNVHGYVNIIGYR